jgi:hypothetical protein
LPAPRYIGEMCGRATYKLTWEEIVALYRLTLSQSAVNTRARYNVRSFDVGFTPNSDRTAEVRAAARPPRTDTKAGGWRGGSGARHPVNTAILRLKSVSKY